MKFKFSIKLAIISLIGQTTGLRSGIMEVKNEK